MKIAVFGSSGMLGAAVCKHLSGAGYDVVRIDRKDIDLSRSGRDQLFSFLERIGIGKGDVAVNCAGVIKQRKEATASDFVSVNSLFPHLLAEFCESRGSRMIHVTTDCIYSGSKGSYTEDDLCDVSDEYGLSKKLGEPDRCTVIRTSIIGEEERNKLSLLEWVRSQDGKRINGFMNHIWNGVTCHQLAKIIDEIVYKESFWNGTRHVFSDRVSKYELVLMIKEIYGLDIEISPVDDSLSIDRSLSSVHEVPFAIPPLFDQIKEAMEFYKK